MVHTLHTTRQIGSGYGYVWGYRLMLSIIYQIPFSLLLLAIWLSGIAVKKNFVPGQGRCAF